MPDPEQFNEQNAGEVFKLSPDTISGLGDAAIDVEMPVNAENDVKTPESNEIKLTAEEERNLIIVEELSGRFPNAFTVLKNEKGPYAILKNSSDNFQHTNIIVLHSGGIISIGPNGSGNDNIDKECRKKIMTGKADLHYIFENASEIMNDKNKKSEITSISFDDENRIDSRYYVKMFAFDFKDPQLEKEFRAGFKSSIERTEEFQKNNPLDEEENPMESADNIMNRLGF